MSWSESDKFFVNSKLEVFTVDLSSESLELTLSKDVIYNGPKSDDFKRFLRSKNLRVNRQGKAIVRVQKRDNDGELLECQYETFILERVFPLDSYGFQTVPLPKPQAVNEVATKDDMLNELQCCLNNTKAYFANTKDELVSTKAKLENTKAELANTLAESMTRNLKEAQFPPSRVLGDQNNFFEFLRRMNRTFVNKNGKYLKFHFTAKNSCKPRHVFYNSIGYLDKDQIMSEPFKLVQFDSNEHGMIIEEGEVSLPNGEGRELTSKATSRIVNEGLGHDCAFTFKNFCFIGKITEVSGTFRKNALVTVFFEQSQHDENCFVDALATTFFVLNTEKIPVWKTVDNKAPKIDR